MNNSLTSLAMFGLWGAAVIALPGFALFRWHAGYEDLHADEVGPA